MSSSPPTVTLTAAPSHPLFPTATAFTIRTQLADSPPPNASPSSTKKIIDSATLPNRDVSIYGLTLDNGNSNPSNPPLLCLHGFPQTLAIWHKVAPELAKHFTVVLLDLRGYGRSSKPKPSTKYEQAKDKDKDDEADSGPAPAAPRGALPAWMKDPISHSLYSKASMAHDCVTVMHHLGHSQFHILAHDRGARVAHSLLTNHSTSALSALLLDITPTLSTFQNTSQALATAYYHWFFLIQPTPFPETLILASADIFAKKSLLGLVGLSEAQRSLLYHDKAWDEYRKWFSDPDAVYAWCEDYRAAAREDCEEQVWDQREGVKIERPIGAGFGAKGVIGKLFDVRSEWEKVAAEGMVKVVKGVNSGHYIPEEAPEELLELCKEFFGKHAGVVW